MPTVVCMIDEISGDPPDAAFTICDRWKRIPGNASTIREEVDCPKCIDRLARGRAPGELSRRVRERAAKQ